MSASRTDRRFARACDAVAADVDTPRALALDGGDGGLVSESVTVRLVENAAWIQTVLTTVGRATNLGFAQAAAHIEGSGPVALGLARRLRGFGARVTLNSGDPVALLSASLDGFDIAVDDTVSPLALLVFATGEGAAFDVSRLGAQGRTVVVIDAARPGAEAAVVADAAGGELRPGLVAVSTSGREAVVLNVADLRDDEYDRASADVRSAFLRHAAAQPAQSETVQADPAEILAAVDTALAKALLP